MYAEHVIFSRDFFMLGRLPQSTSSVDFDAKPVLDIDLEIHSW
jgi:hypothetical protein